jgi:Ca2+-binding EF-hand superfamily protein
MQHLSGNFDKLDSNKDGKVTHEEMRAARKAHKAGKQ